MALVSTVVSCQVSPVIIAVTLMKYCLIIPLRFSLRGGDHNISITVELCGNEYNSSGGPEGAVKTKNNEWEIERCLTHVPAS